MSSIHFVSHITLSPITSLITHTVAAMRRCMRCVNAMTHPHSPVQWGYGENGRLGTGIHNPSHHSSTIHTYHSTYHPSAIQTHHPSHHPSPIPPQSIATQDLAMRRPASDQHRCMWCVTVLWWVWWPGWMRRSSSLPTDQHSHAAATNTTRCHA